MRSLAENQDVAGLHKMPTGVEGFDAITGGGLPRNRTSLILGGPASEKPFSPCRHWSTGTPSGLKPGLQLCGNSCHSSPLMSHCGLSSGRPTYGFYGPQTTPLPGFALICV